MMKIYFHEKKLNQNSILLIQYVKLDFEAVAINHCEIKNTKNIWLSFDYNFSSFYL